MGIIDLVLEEDNFFDEEFPFGTATEVIHEPMCWKEHGLCATKRLEELLTLLKMSKKKTDRDELIKIIEG